MRINDILLEVPAIHDHRPKEAPNRTYGGNLENPPLGHLLWWVGQSPKQFPGGEEMVGKVYAFPDPSTGVYAYKKGSLDKAIKNVAKLGAQRGINVNNIVWVNQKARDSNPDAYNAFCVAQTRDENNKFHWVGKYLSNTSKVESFHKSEKSGTLDRFDTNDLGPELEYYSERPRSSKAQGPEDLSNILRIPSMKPEDIFTNISTPRTVAEILNGIKARFGDGQMFDAARQAAAGQTPIIFKAPIPNQMKGLDDKTFAEKIDSKFYQIDVDYPEVLHPLLVLSGRGYSGDPLNIDPASKVIFSPSGGGLWDSKIIQPDGSEITISSKKNEGSAAVLGDEIQKALKNIPNEAKSRYKLEYDIVDSLSKSKGWAKDGDLGPLNAASMLPEPIINKTDAAYFSKTFGNKENFNKAYADYDPAEIAKLSTSHPTLYSAIQNSKSAKIQALPLYHSTLKYIMEHLRTYFNKQPDQKMIKFLNLLFKNSDVVFMSTYPNIVKQGEQVIDTQTYKIRHVSEDTPELISLLASETYRDSGHESETRMKYKLGPDNTDSFDDQDVLAKNLNIKDKNVRQLPSVDPIIRQQTNPKQPAVPTVDPAVRQQTIALNTSVLNTPGSPLHQALMAIDPAERNEAREDALFDINAGKSTEEVMARLKAWLDESSSFKRFKYLINYK